MPEVPSPPFRHTLMCLNVLGGGGGTRSWSQDDGVNRAGHVAEAAVNAFHNVDVERVVRTRLHYAVQPLNLLCQDLAITG
jgi:hypothetical protein